MPPLANPSATQFTSDYAVSASVADLISHPRQEAANSFVLHAPLELLARAGLLAYVRHDARSAALERILEIGQSFADYAPATLSAAASFDSAAEALGELAKAMSNSDLERCDAIAAWLGDTLSPVELAAALTDPMISSLAAAAHAPIFLWLAPRVAPRWQLTGRLLRPLVRELARGQQLQLRWIDRREHSLAATAAEMTAALAATPLLGEIESDFIFPTMNRVDSDELARALLGPVCGAGDVRDRGRAVMRAAAWSMLNEPTKHAPYGWSHALTMSQAAIGIAPNCADPSRALAVGATYVMGFRASLAVNPLTESFNLEPVELAISDAITAGADVAGAAAWYAPVEQRTALISELATRAATHSDAHLAKYTLACFDAAGDDPGATRLFLAAAAKLVGYWSTEANASSH